MDFDALGPEPSRIPAAVRPQTGSAFPIAELQFAGERVRFSVYTDARPDRLMQRLRSASHLTQATAWTNPIVAERAMGTALAHFGAEVFAWLRDPGPLPFVRDFTAPYVVGSVMARPSDRLPTSATPVVSTQTFRLMLRTSPEPPGFIIASSEPLPPLPEHGVATSSLDAYESRSAETLRTRGHTVGRHTGHTLADAVARLRAEPLITADGCFDSVAVAEDVKATMIDAYGREIAGWLTNAGDSMPLTREMRFGRDIGWVLERQQLEADQAAGRGPQAERATGARLVLRKSNDFAEGYYVLTMYPLI